MLCVQHRWCPFVCAVLAGWGTSFHFAHRLKHETHMESIRRHEHYLALRLGLKPGAPQCDCLFAFCGAQ